ncbi:MAG: DNA-binding response regulator [Cyanobacteria bacterium DS2.3.42]|nr:DNA-binding response regulator [Cyanobacteria bacterium DS2.3.42]
MPTILLVEDDQDLATTVTDHLVSERYTVEHAADGLIAQEMLTITSFDLIILDWSLPGKTGIEICSEFRARGGMTPIIMLTGKRQIEEKEEGLDTGADDYLTKPFSLRELSARVRALMRRPEQVASTVIAVGDLTLDVTEHSLCRKGERIHLQKQDFALLEFLMRHPNQVFTSEALINRVWGVESEATAESVRSAIKRLRQKLDTPNDEISVIENISRVGYRLNNKA